MPESIESQDFCLVLVKLPEGSLGFRGKKKFYFLFPFVKSLRHFMNFKTTFDTFEGALYKETEGLLG